MTYDVIIIGGGCAGLILGCLLGDKKYLILEASDRVGRKLLATGNGKCNLSNTAVSKEGYNDPRFVEYALEKYKFSVYDFYPKIGVMLKTVEDRIYPYSESAATVLSALIAANHGEIKTAVSAEKIEKIGTEYLINGAYRTKNVVLASGTNATLGKNSHTLFASFGHKTTELIPSITAIKTEDKYIKSLENLRAKVRLTLLKNGREVSKRDGEVLFKKDGVSGIVAFETSTFIAREKGDYTLSIDFAPDRTAADLSAFSLSGIVKRPIADAIAAYGAKMNPCDAAKDFRLKVKGLYDAKNAQVMCGGLETSYFDNKSMESLLSRGLYAIGEVLNVDGECGGYNLHWALVSALSAAESLLTSNNR